LRDAADAFNELKQETKRKDAIQKAVKLEHLALQLHNANRCSAFARDGGGQDAPKRPTNSRGRECSAEFEYLDELEAAKVNIGSTRVDLLAGGCFSEHAPRPKLKECLVAKLTWEDKGMAADEINSKLVTAGCNPD
jgi:hypothetical protein